MRFLPMATGARCLELFGLHSLGDQQRGSNNREPGLCAVVLAGKCMCLYVLVCDTISHHRTRAYAKVWEDGGGIADIPRQRPYEITELPLTDVRAWFGAGFVLLSSKGVRFGIDR